MVCVAANWNELHAILSKLVGHASRHFNVKCGVSGCDELSFAALWYEHMRFHHMAEYYDNALPHIC